MGATYIRCAAERHLGKESMGVLKQASVPLCREELLARYAGQVQMVYLDPPFNTGKCFEMKVRIGEKGYKDGSPTLSLPAYDDRWESKEAYLAMMRDTLVLARDLMKKEGTIFVHIDCRMHAHMRLLMDEIFGENNFLNEIIWSYQSGGRARTYFPRKHDVILFYAKSRSYYFNIKAVPIARGDARSNHMKRGTDEDGRTYRSIMSGGKEYRYYDDTPVYPGDVWTDISHLQQRDPERTGYATQKPLKLLDRLLRPVVKEGDLVCDLCCGSGTTLLAAQQLGCRFIGVDKSPEALLVARSRLKQENVTLLCPASDNAAAIEASLDNGVLILTDFHARHKAFPATEQTFDRLESWAVGYWTENGMVALQHFQRTVKNPDLPLMAFLPELPGPLAVSTVDAAGRRWVYRWT